MDKILVAVDEKKLSTRIAETVVRICKGIRPEKIVLLYVQKLEGDSFMDDMLMSESEIATLKSSLEGTEYQQRLDEKSKKILDYFENFLAKEGLQGIKSVIRQGHPAEEILAAAREEEVNLIVMGSRGSRFYNFFMGSVSREVANQSEISVLLVK